MNIYNFIYCFFYSSAKKRGGGIIDSAAHVLFAMIVHVLLISEIIWDVTGFNVLKLPNYGQYGRNKMMYFLFIIPFWIGLCFFYNKTRTKELVKEYSLKYAQDGRKNIVKILIFMIAPIIVIVALALVRQKVL